MRAAKVKFESPLPHNNTVMKPTPVAGFIIYKNNSVKTVSNLYFFRKPKIVKAKHGWYVQYHYMIPVELRSDYDGKKWLRFRVKEDMNRSKEFSN